MGGLAGGAHHGVGAVTRRCLCAICADRLADTIAVVEGFTGVERARPVCWPCLSPDPVPTPARYYEPVDLGGVRHGNGGAIERVVSVVAAIGEGATQDIALAMGIAPRVDGMTSEERRPYNALVAVLKRAAESGAVGWRWRIPGSPSAGRIYWRAA